jgi:acyl carrier protein
MVVQHCRGVDNSPERALEKQEMSESTEAASAKASDLHDRVKGVIYSALSELNVQRPRGEQVEQSLSTTLFGAGGRLDSLALANFIVIAEAKLEGSLGFQIDLTQDDPFSSETGHFRTVQSLIDYISRLVQQGNEDGHRSSAVPKSP